MPKRPSLLDRIGSARTVSTLAELAGSILHSHEDFEALKRRFEQQMKSLHAVDIAQGVFDEAMKLARLNDPEFEDIFLFYSHCESVSAIALMGLEGAEELREQLAGHSLALLESNANFSEVLERYFPQWQTAIDRSAAQTGHSKERLAG